MESNPDTTMKPDFQKEALKLFKKYAKLSWLWEWTEKHGAMNHTAFIRALKEFNNSRDKEIEELKAEIERLSKLIKRIYKISEYDANHDNIMYAFQDIHRLCEKIIKQGISPRPTS